MSKLRKNNKMNPVKVLIRLFLRSRHNEKIDGKIQDWLLEDDKADEKDDALHEEFEMLDYGSDNDVRKSLEAVNRKIGFEKRNTKRISFNGYSLRVAAVITPLIVIGSVFYMLNTENSVKDDSHFVEVTVPYGEHEVKHLACGSNVWINAGSTVKYKDGETIEERHVDLSGEAYFSVEKIGEKPFIVHTDHLNVKVQGTEFNVEAYPEEQKTIVTLDKGSIEVETETHRLYTLKPNQQLIYDHNTGLGMIKYIAADAVSDASAWKEWNLNFDEATLSQIINKVEKRFDIIIEAEERFILTNEIYTVQFTKDDNVEKVMKILEKMVDNMSYQITDNVVFINVKK